MDTYSAILHYFKKIEKAIHCSADGKQALTGIKKTTNWLVSSLNFSTFPTHNRVLFSFILDGQVIYYHRGYSSYFHNSKTANLYSWRGPQTEIKVDFNERAKDLVPYEVYVTINGIECTYSIADFILLDDSLDDSKKTDTTENSQKSEEDKRDTN